MSKSPLLSQQTDRISYEIKIDGTKLKSKYHVVFVEIVQKINKLPQVTLEILDGSPADQKFENLDQLKIKPSQTIEISAGYIEQNNLLFKGFVTSVGSSSESGVHGRILVEATDACHELTLNRKSRYFEKQKDSDIVNKILKDYGNASCKTDTTKTKHDKIVQYLTTDWDFILSRASVCERIVVAEKNKLNFVKPGGDTTAKLTYGTDIIDFDINIDGSKQSNSVEVKGWDPSSHSFKTGKSSEPSYIEKLGSTKGKGIAGDFNVQPEKFSTSTPMDTNELNDYATSKLMFSRLSKVKGYAKFQGFADVKLNSFVTIEKIHSYFEGKVYVSGITHKIEKGNFTTKIEFGVDSEAIYENSQKATMSGNIGAMPAIQGLVIGTVTKMDGDPKNDFRVQVKVPMINEDDKGLWARLTSPYSGEKGGFIWYPEVGDQVILGFLMNDPRHPIILGSLYSKTFSPYQDFRPASGNHKKAIVTRSHMEMSFDDQKKNIQVRTPGELFFDMKDEKKSIELKDCHGNYIKMSSKGIEIYSKTNIKITAKNEVKIGCKSLDGTGSSKVHFSSNSDIKHQVMGSKLQLSTSSGDLKSMQLNLEGMGTATVKGGGMLDLKATGVAKLNGSVVLIK